VWNIQNNRSPGYLQNMFVPQRNVHSYNTRSSSHGAYATLSSHRQSLLHNGTKAFNALPDVLRSHTSCHAFKVGVCDHLLAT